MARRPASLGCSLWMLCLTPGRDVGQPLVRPSWFTHRVNFRVVYSNGISDQHLGDEDSYRVLRNGALRLDITTDGRRIRRYASPSGWVAIDDFEPVDYEDDPDL